MRRFPVLALSVCFALFSLHKRNALEFKRLKTVTFQNLLCLQIVQTQEILISTSWRTPVYQIRLIYMLVKKYSAAQVFDDIRFRSANYTNSRPDAPGWNLVGRREFTTETINTDRHRHILFGFETIRTYRCNLRVSFSQQTVSSQRMCTPHASQCIRSSWLRRSTR